MGHKAGTTDGAQGRDDGWGTRQGRRMGRKAGTTDVAQGRDDGWGSRPGRRMGLKAGTTDGAQGWDDGWGTRPCRRMGHRAGTLIRYEAKFLIGSKSQPSSRKARSAYPRPKVNQIKLNRLFIKIPAQGWEDGWGARPGRRVGAQGRNERHKKSGI